MFVLDTPIRNTGYAFPTPTPRREYVGDLRSVALTYPSPSIIAPSHAASVSDILRNIYRACYGTPMTVRKHHVHPRKHGNHGARKMRRACPSPDAPNYRAGAQYGVRGNMQHKPAEEKGKK